jgi:8-oxo-dGTP pyrophosphatase MutT (NUDIX family)
MKQSKSKKSQKSAIRLQYGVLPFRWNKRNGLQILLVTSRETRRWIVPKGWPIKDLKPAESAAREAYEEAGIRWTVKARSIGSFLYDKRLADPDMMVSCEVKLFALAVERQERDWPEKGQRDSKWVSIDEALHLAGDAGLKDVIQGFAERLLKTAGY